MAKQAHVAYNSREWYASPRALDQQVQFEASRGCGQRNPSLDGGTSQLREGDIVYLPPRTGFSGANEPSWYPPPPANCSTQPGVAVVVKVRRKEVYSPEGVRRSLAFGGVDLLMWDLVQLRFGRLEQDVESGMYTPCSHYAADVALGALTCSRPIAGSGRMETI